MQAQVHLQRLHSLSVPVRAAAHPPSLPFTLAHMTNSAHDRPQVFVSDHFGVLLRLRGKAGATGVNE